ncbi:mediator of RNA polymerase II transcription subunit 16 [Macrobrachium rosenbergii]|uniref:mediator of RNA polymerase II transcription subunit 16 n=1 Tax=Macrobrachium rosenbergii TaxID=79674 RepID=UPI0034D5B166
MDHIYTVGEKRSLDEGQSLSSLYDDGGICTISPKSVVAFTRMTSKQDMYRHRVAVCTVCVVDLNCPYEPHAILETQNKVTALKFSCDGSLLLVVQGMGCVELFEKGAGMDKWSSVHKCDWDGEDILHIDFFHGGIRACLTSSDLKVNSPYTEKFGAQAHKPTLMDHGQFAHIGFFAVTASGLLLLCALTHEGTLFTEKKVVLGQTRDNFTVASAALAPSGHIHIATWKPEVIKCWRAELKLPDPDYGGGKRDIKVNIQAAQSFCPFRSGTAWHNSQKNEGLVRVSCLRYTEYEDPNSLLVGLTVEKPAEGPAPQQGANTSSSTSVVHLVQRYQLQDQSRPLLKLFMPKPDAPGITTKEWMCVGEWISSSSVVTLGTTLRHLIPGSQLPFVVTAATSDGYIYAINRDTMQQISSHNIQNTRGSGDEPPISKRASVDRRVVSLSHSWNGFSLLAMDSLGSLHFLTLVRPLDVGPQWAVTLILLLEFALVSGYDWWDLLILCPTSSVQTLSDKLTETFMQHSVPLVQHLYTRFLVMKTSMLRLMGSQQQRAIEARLQAQLTAIQQLFRSLRPVTCDVATADKNISASLQAYLESRPSLDILDIDKSLDNILTSINIKDCQIDPGMLQNLQPLIQFSVDLALFILFMLAQNSKFELARDPKIVQSLRELLFVARLWNRQNKLVQPQLFHKTQSVDVWAQIYKLLTRIAQILPAEPDSSLIDECLLLETQVVCRELPLNIPHRGVLADMASSKPFPLQYEFGQGETNVMNNNSQSHILEGALPPIQHLDPLHYHYLAPQEPKLNCTRCCSVRASWWGDVDAVWDQHWASNCLCSGHWARTPVNPSKAA